MTRLNNRDIPIEVLERGKGYVLLDISPVYEYDSENKRTDKIVGWAYTVANTESFEKYRIKVAGARPIIARDALIAKRENGIKTFVEFDNAVVKMYWSSSTKTFEDSFKADGISLVKNEE